MANSKISALTAATTPVAGTETLPIVQGGVTKQVSIANLTAGRSVSALQYQAAINSSTAWAPDTSATNIQVNNSAAAANSTSLYLAQVVDDASTTGGVKFGAVAVASATSGGYSADFVVANRKTGTYYENLRVKWNGDISFVTGNIIQGTAAKGINFTANTGAAGMTSQLLNWYEEGTWTPTDVSGAGLSLTLSGTAYYVRTGSLVHVWAFINYPATSNGNNAEIGGLPFTSKSGNNVSGTVFSNYATALSTYANGGTSAFTLRTPGNTVLTNANLSSLFVVVSISYRV